jgi:hypothetical protein
MLLVFLIVGIIGAIMAWVCVTVPPRNWHQLQRWRRDESNDG